jgi:hypothetical protein
MTERILGPTGSTRRRRFLWVPALLIACTALFLIGSAQAVHDEGFQLDGDLSTACPAALPLCTSSQKDWVDLFTVTDTATTETVSNSSVFNAAGPFTNGTFTRDFESGASCTLNSLSTTFCTGDDTTFATGSKDTLDITGWQCNHDNNVNSKIDIMNAYAGAYVVPAGGVNAGDKIMYFGLEKNKDNGTNDVGFWFLQGNASCSAPSGHQDWSGKHTVGDVLVVSEFTNGGGVSNITAYRWVGGTNPLTQIGTAGDCKISSGNDTMCATTNSGATQFNTTVTTPWLTSDATGGVGRTKIVPPDFFEGGINLTKAFAQSGGGTVPSCFNTFIADTRSSNVTGSTLFDYARGQLGQCTTTLTTTAAGTASGSIGTGSVSSGVDTATLTINGTPTWGGHLSWYLCGPVATDGCDNTKGVPVTDRDVSQASPASDFISGPATLTSAGRYCWTAHFEPNQATKDAGILPLNDSGANECFDVAAVTPTLTTSATCSPLTGTDCVLGTGTLSDKAFLTGTASQPGTDGGGTPAVYKSINPVTTPAAAGGTITWVLYGPTNGGCTDTKATSPASATVSGDRPGPGTFYGPTTYTPVLADGVGTYTFVANYGGNGPNTNAAATNTCASPGANEAVTIIGSASSASKQRWLPNDRIVLSTTAGTLNGTLTATLYQGSFSGTAANCTAGSATAVSGQSYSFTISGDASGTAYQTTNTDPASAGHTTFYVGSNPNGTAAGAAGTYFWLIHYVDTNLTDPADRCETSTLTITD